MPLLAHLSELLPLDDIVKGDYGLVAEVHHKAGEIVDVIFVLLLVGRVNLVIPHEQLLVLMPVPYVGEDTKKETP